MGAKKTLQSEPPIGSRLYPLYKVEGHGAHWRPIMEDACFIFPKGGRSPSNSPEAIVITRYIFPEQPYKHEAERYIEIIHRLRQLPGGSGVCEDIFEKVAVATKETTTIEQGGKND